MTATALAMVAMVAFGVQAIALAAATRLTPPLFAVVVAVTAELAVGLIALAIWPSVGRPSDGGLMLAVIAGLFGMLGYVAFGFALSRGNAALVTALAAMYPVIVMIGGGLLRGETLTVRQLAAMVFAIAAAALAL